MTRPSNILISTVLRNQRFRGPTSSAQQNDFQAEVIRDVTAIQDQWNNLIVPLSQRISDGTLDEDINAFRDGLDGRTLYTHTDATSNTDSGQYFITTLNRPRTVFEQFQDVYNSIDNAVNDLENQITSAGSGGGLTSEQQAAIGDNIFNAALQSSPSSLDGRSQSNQLNVTQLAKDLYGAAGASFSGDGSAILTNSVMAMVDALLELHNGNWDNDISLSHTITLDDITGGSLDQEVVNDSASTGTGVDDTYAGSPTNLVEDLNQIRTQLRNIKDASAAWTNSINLNANWGPVTADPTDFKLLTDLKGSAARSDTNPWGYDYTDVEGLNTRLQAGADYAGQSSQTDDTPAYSTLLGFSNGDSLTTAIGGLASEATNTKSNLSGIATEMSGHHADFNNPHLVDLGQAASQGGFAPAGQMTIVDSGAYYDSVYAEGALQEVYADLLTISGELQTQIDAGVDTSEIEADIVDLQVSGANARVDIDNLKVEFLSVLVGAADNKNYPLVNNFPYGGTVDSVTTTAFLGSGEWSLFIEGTQVGDTYLVNSGLKTTTNFGNSFSATDELDITVSGVAGLQDLLFTIQLTRN